MDPMANVDWPLLLRCGERFASLLGLEAPPEVELRACIEKVLFGREALAAAREGLITERELVNLLLAHLHTLILDHSGMRPPEKEPLLDDGLLPDMHRALFGTEA